MSDSIDADESTPLLQQDTVGRAVDFKHRPAIRSIHGGWRSSAFIIGVEIAERICYCGISSNLITFLTSSLGESTAMAAANVNAWFGFATLFPVVGALVADSFLGKYLTILLSSLLYILGLGMLTLSAILLPTPTNLNDIETFRNTHGYSRRFLIITFFTALYLVAIGQGGHKPSAQAFGADQFDENDPNESKAKSSFFNWWYFGVSMGSVIGVVLLSFVQGNLSWGYGFGVPCIIMVVALIVFLLGTMTYRFTIKSEGQSPFRRFGKVFLAAVRNRCDTCFTVGVMEDEHLSIQVTQPHHGSNQLSSFIGKALHGANKEEVEEAKGVLKLFPIWAPCLTFGIITAQTNTFFTKQGVTLDRSITPNFTIPAASLQSLIGICVLIILPIYDRIFVPIARALTGKAAGISMLQRMGIGLLISTVTMIVAAIIEKKRLMVAFEYELVDQPNVTIPMSICWLLPQYALFGTSEAFVMVGMQEFFYDQMPSALKTMGVSLYLSVFGIGSLLSSLLISIIDKTTTSGDGSQGWFSNNLNRAHVDYFYWLLACLSAIGLFFFTCFANSYVYIKRSDHM